MALTNSVCYELIVQHCGVTDEVDPVDGWRGRALGNQCSVSH